MGDTGFSLGVDGFSVPGKEALPGAENAFEVFHVVFNVIFTVELICRLQRAKCQFYKSLWLWLDLVVVPLAWLETFHVLRSNSIPMLPPAMLRMLRVLRLCQLTKTMECFPTLNLLIRSLKSSFGALVWCLVLIVF